MGQDVAAILGSAQVLSEGNRTNAIAALARAGRMPRNTTGAEAEIMLVGATQGARATAIGEMARYVADGLSGADLVAILGRNGETTEGNRHNAIAALSRARKIGTTLSGADVASVVQGTSGGTRDASIAEIKNPANQSAAQPSAVASAPVPVIQNTAGVGFRSTSDFVLEPASVKRNADNSLYLELRVFNLTEADGVLEVYDSSGRLTDFPKAILGNRRLPDSVYALVVENQLKVGSGLTQYVLGGASPLDPRSVFQSRLTELSVTVPPRGSFRITKAGRYALVYNVLFLCLDIVGYIDGPTATTISKHRMQEIASTLVNDFSTQLTEAIAARSFGELAAFAVKLSFDLVKASVLTPENLDGRTVLGKALKKYLITASPYLSELETVVAMGDAFNWINTIANLRAAGIRDTSISIQRGS